MRLLRRLVLAPVRTILALVFLGGLAAGPARGQAIYSGALDGASVTPPNASTGTGTSEVTLEGDQLLVDLSFSGLLGPTTASHIHCCAIPPSNVGVAVNYLGFPTGVTSGTYANTFDLTSAGTYLAAFINFNGGTVGGARAALLTGLAAGWAYTCVHTTSFGGGEIRSQFAFASFVDGFESGETDEWSAVVP